MLLCCKRGEGADAGAAGHGQLLRMTGPQAGLSRAPTVFRCLSVLRVSKAVYTCACHYVCPVENIGLLIYSSPKRCTGDIGVLWYLPFLVPLIG